MFLNENDFGCFATVSGQMVLHSKHLLKLFYLLERLIFESF